MSTDTKPAGSLGVAMKRKEDPRFIRGKGRFVDDISLPGMLYQAVVRSPYPHAEIKSIDIAAALKVPGVKAVITGKDLEAAGLGWLPTFHGQDKQMVLAIGKVLFQYQEVAAVFADTRAAAADGAEAVEVEYAPLPVVADPSPQRRQGHPPSRSREEVEPHLSLGRWRQGRHGARARNQRHSYQPARVVPALPPGAARTLRMRRGIRCDGPAAVLRDLTGPARLPHGAVTGHRHPRGQDPRGRARHRRRFGNKVPVYPGYVCAIVGALKLGRPVKWMETRTENLTSTGFARDYHIDVEIGATADGKVTALRVATAADHGAFDAAADPVGYPAGLFGIVTGSYDFPTAYAEVDGFFTNKAPGGIAYRCSFRVTEASYAIERGMDILADELGMIRQSCGAELHPPRPVPVSLAARLHLRQRRLSQDARPGAREDRYQDLLKEQAEKRARVS